MTKPMSSASTGRPIRDGQVGPRPVYAAIGVDLEGHRDVLGMWAGEGDGEPAK